MNGFNRAVTTHPWFTIVLFLLVTVGFASRIPSLHIEPDVRSMMPKNNEVFLFSDWAEDYFGIRDPALVCITNDGPDGVFTPHTLALVTQLSDEVAALDAIDGDDVISLSLIDNITGEDDALIVEPFFETPPTTAKEAEAIRAAVNANPMMVGSVVSQDGQATSIIGELNDGFDKVELYAVLKGIVESAPVTTEQVFIAGRPVIEGELGRQAELDIRRMFPLVILVSGVMLYVVLRSIRGVILPLLVVITAVIWTMGGMAWTGATFFAITSMMPSLLIAIGVADGIHVLHHFMLSAGRNPEASAADITLGTMNEMARPVILTSLTTAAGFAALSVSPMRPIQGFGIFTAFGVLAAMVFSLTILPALLCVLPVPRKAAERAIRAQKEARGPLAILLRTLTPLITRHPLLASSGGVVMVIIGLTGLPRVVVDGSMLANFPPDNPVKQADAEISTRFGGTQPLQVVLDAGEADAWKNPEKLRAVDAFQTHVENAGYGGESRSIADYVKRMNHVLQPEIDDSHRIPDDQDLIAQYLFLYSISGDPDDFDDVVDYDYAKANVRLQLGSDHAPFLKGVLEDIDAYAAKHLAPLGIETQPTGIGRTMYEFMDLIIIGQVRSLVLALVLVAILTGMMCRSAAAGLLAVLPVAVASLLNFGLLAWFNQPLGVTTAMLSSMGIGIGIDYAIHFLVKYQRERQGGHDPEEAMGATLGTSGVAILYNALVVLVGFSVLATSEFPPNRALGVLVSLNMCVCCLGTLTMMAAVLHWANPAFVQPRAVVAS